LKNFYSNGKLLLTGEYLVLDGAKSLALPTKFGQDLTVNPIPEPQLVWGSFTHTGACWFEAVFELPKLRLIHCYFDTDREGNSEMIAETLLEILQEAKRMNPSFLETQQGFLVKTTLNFPRNWGLGSSSTLINSIASWAAVDAFQLLWNSFKGSGYDVACAQNNSPILYQIQDQKPVVIPVEFNPSFKDKLFFVYLNQKQDSKEGIATYKKTKVLGQTTEALTRISALSEAFLKADSLEALNAIIVEHEKIVGAMIQLKPVKEVLFPDYFGEIKSLGAWGGDFVLATGNEDTPSYFEKKGYATVLRYHQIIL
jgi:mevalonate kinase